MNKHLMPFMTILYILRTEKVYKWQHLSNNSSSNDLDKNSLLLNHVQFLLRKSNTKIHIQPILKTHITNQPQPTGKQRLKLRQDI